VTKKTPDDLLYYWLYRNIKYYINFKNFHLKKILSYLWEAGTAYTSQAPGVTPSLFGGVKDAHPFSFLFSLSLFWVLMPILAISGLSILDANVAYLWIVHSWCQCWLSLDCPFLIALSPVFSNVSFQKSLLFSFYF
jgi:hypothetical protein